MARTEFVSKSNDLEIAWSAWQADVVQRQENQSGELNPKPNGELIHSFLQRSDKQHIA
jgi:hypothetical protein